MRKLVLTELHRPYVFLAHLRDGIWTQVLWLLKPKLFPQGPYPSGGTLTAGSIFPHDLRDTLTFCKSQGHTDSRYHNHYLDVESLASFVPIVEMEVLIPLLWILRPSPEAEFLVWNHLPSEADPHKPTEKAVDFFFFFSAWWFRWPFDDCWNHRNLAKVYKRGIIIVIWSSPSTSTSIFTSFSRLTKLCGELVASSKIWMSCSSFTDGFLKYCRKRWRRLSWI